MTVAEGLAEGVSQRRKNALPVASRQAGGILFLLQLVRAIATIQGADYQHPSSNCPADFLVATTYTAAEGSGQADGRRQG